jgi:hypothetical protein
MKEVVNQSMVLNINDYIFFNRMQATLILFKNLTIFNQTKFEELVSLVMLIIINHVKYISETCTMRDNVHENLITLQLGVWYN